MIVEVDLDTDPAEPFAYLCDGAIRGAMIDYADIIDVIDSEAAAVVDMMCTENPSWSWVPGDWKEDPYPLFSVKQMNPGPGMGRQNRMKDYEDCVSSGA